MITGSELRTPPSERSWLNTPAFAEITGLTRQAACRALKGALSGAPWRGHQLEVRSCLTRGGRRGLAYEVARESLPPKFRPAEPAEDHYPLARPVVAGSDQLILKRWEAIKDTVDHPRGSPQRARAVEMAALSGCASERTLYRWIDQYEANGLRGLGRAKASNAGEPRVWVSVRRQRQ